MKVEVAVLDSPSLTVLMVSVDVKQTLNLNKNWTLFFTLFTERLHVKTSSL